MRETTPIAGRYELIQQITTGGMGQVWRGYDAVLDREVAVKLIRPDVVHTSEQAREFAGRFRREARLTARIRHHGVPQVYDAVLDQPHDRMYLVMELVDGTSLRAFIDPDRPLPVPWATALAAQIATVLAHAHTIPAVHRDLKPDNILVTPGGSVKLLDFGIAAIMRTDVTRLTATGQPLGTTRYMSPEQIQGGRVTPRSDLYALGCVLHELLTGRRLFPDGTAYQLMHQHVHEPPPPVRQLRPDVPQPLAQLVRDLLAKAPRERPVDAYEVYERLLPWLPAPGTAPPAQHPAPAGAPDPTRVFRRPNPPPPRPDDDTDQFAGQLPAPTRPPAPGHATTVNNALREAEAQAGLLLDQERFQQAAQVLAAVLPQATEALGSHHARVLRLREKYAATLMLGGDYRQALREFDALTAAYRRTNGADSMQAVECLRQAAYCRAELGDAGTALRDLRQVLAHLRAARTGDLNPTVVDLRRNIAMLSLSQGGSAQATEELEQLYDDLCLMYGTEHAETREVADILARLRLTG